MKKNVLRIFSLVVLAAMLFSFAACSGTSSSNEQVLTISMLYDENSPYKPGGSANAVVNNNVGGNAQAGTNTPAGNNQGSAATPATPDANTPSDGGNQGGNATPATPDANTPSDGGNQGSNLPSTPADILAKYTEVANNLKTNCKTLKKKEFQKVENLELGAITSIANSLIPQFLTDESKAEVKEEQAGAVPPWGDKGCLLTDASFIKAAACKDNGDGTATITITLKDETNPEPATDGVSPSETGKIFSPLKKADIDNTLAGIKVITVEKFDLVYHDCTVNVTYNTSNNQVTSMTQVMNIDVTARVKALVATVDASGTVINTMQITDLK